MKIADLAERGMVLLGCGKMGSALLEGWLDGGLDPKGVTILDPNPSDWLQSLDDININTTPPVSPALALIAVKPQMMGDALPQIASFGGGKTLIVTVAAGTPVAAYEALFGDNTPIVRAMPNTPAAVNRGITALIGNETSSDLDLQLAAELMRAVGDVVFLENEGQMDAVTGLSGSGPAYVFHLIEALAAAGEAEGLSPELAMELARATVSGAGELARQSEETAAQLRINVTSPQGTTAAGLEVLMNPETGLPPLAQKTVAAAAARSRELSK